MTANILAVAVRNPVKFIKQILYGLGRYADTIVFDRDFFLIAIYSYLNTISGVFDCIVNQII